MQRGFGLSLSWLLRAAGIVGHGRKLGMSSRCVLRLGQGRRRDHGGATAQGLFAAPGKFRLTFGAGIAVGIEEGPMVSCAYWLAAGKAAPSHCGLVS